MTERILHVLNGLGTGGIEKYVMDLFRHIDTNKYVFDFLLRKDGDNYKDLITKLGGKIYTVSPYPEEKMQNFADVDSFFAEHREYSIVHIHAPSLEYVNILKLAKKHKIKSIILHSHCSSRDSVEARIIHHMNRLTTRNCPTDRFACSEKAGKWMFGTKNYVFISNGIDTKKFSFSDEKRGKIRNELGLKDEFVWGHVGRLCKTKNQQYVLRLFKEQLLINPHSRLLIVGSGNDMRILQNLALNLGISDKVLFLGQRNDIDSIMCAMDVLVFPSLDEGFPITIVEAQSVGLPCVVSDVITRQIEITDLVTFLSLKNTSKEWIYEINKSGGHLDRDNYFSIVKNAGFDIVDTSKRMESFYDKKYKK